MTGMFQSSSTASGSAALAGLERLLTVLSFEDLEVEAFQDPARNLADDAGIINDETSSHVNLCF